MIEYTIKREITICVAERQDEKINNPASLSKMLAAIIDPHQEELWVLVLNSQMQSVERHLMAKGGQNSVNTSAANVLRPVIVSGMKNFILAHNHPSGDTTPSEQDDAFTKQIVKAAKLMGLEILDHVIINAMGEYHSYRREGQI